MGRREAGECDTEPDAVEQEEQHVLATEAGPGAGPPGPVPIREVGEGRRERGRDDLVGQDLVRDRPAVVLQQVERAGVEDVGKQADGAELGDLVAELREAR